MVSKVEEAKKMKRRQQQPQQQQWRKQIQCNKGKVGKFKRSSNLEDDGVSSAILFLACIACAPALIN